MTFEEFLFLIGARPPPTSHPAYGLPIDRSVMRDQVGSERSTQPLGRLASVWSQEGRKIIKRRGTASPRLARKTR